MTRLIKSIFTFLNCREIKQKKSTVTGIFNKFINDQSSFDFKVTKGDLKRSLEFKVLTHVSKFTNDLVGQDFLIGNHTTLNSKRGKLPKLTSIQSSQINKIQFGGEKKMYDTRGKMNFLNIMNNIHIASFKRKIMK